MKTLLKNGRIFKDGEFVKKDILVNGKKIERIADTVGDEGKVIDCSGDVILPGFIDVHVHFREPGFEYKETIRTGSMAAAHGGYTAVCTMPNLKPAPCDEKSLRAQTDIISTDAAVRVYPYGAITESQSGRGELSRMEDMARMKYMDPFGDEVRGVIAFSDDGKGVQTKELMRSAMIKAGSLGKMIVAHCEDESLLDGGYIHKGVYAEKKGHKGICSESEWKQVERDILLSEETGCPYHVCHISTKETVALIRDAKKRGVDVTCETAPHYLVFCDEELKEDGRFKMNPPVRSAADREALLEGIKDGTIDMIATDHAPHSAVEKSRGLKGSMFGISGLEAAFPVLYTKLVKSDIIDMCRLIELLSVNPAKRFKIPYCTMEEGAPADLSVWRLSEKEDISVSGDDFLSMGRCTIFEGMMTAACCRYTLCAGSAVYGE